MADLGEEAFSSQMKVVATFLRLLEELMRNKQQDLRYGTKTQRRGILGRMKDFVGGMPGTAASLPYQVFREVVNEHDTNYLIALAIAIDALPKDSTCDMASETIRANADIDIAERRKSVLPDQAGLAAKKASCIESLAHIGGNAPVCGQNEIAR